MPRYLIAASAPLVLSICAYGFRLTSRIGLAAASVLVVLCGLFNFQLHDENLKDGYREACVQLVDHLRPGDAIAVCTAMPDGFSEAPVKFYLEESILRSTKIINVNDVDQFREWHKQLAMQRRPATYPHGPVQVAVRRCAEIAPRANDPGRGRRDSEPGDSLGHREEGKAPALIASC